MRGRFARAGVLIGVVIAAIALSTTVRGQIASAPARFLASPAQVVAVRAGRLFDARSGTMLPNQIVLITGDRITDVGSSVTIPPAPGSSISVPRLFFRA